jgi:Lon-like ATP-dependent protease
MESDGKDKLIEKFRERAASLKMPEVTWKVFEEELAKLQGLEPAASEANVTGLVDSGMKFIISDAISF